jgi:glycosyltransferase involved in cell wall biosynthesis
MLKKIMIVYHRFPPIAEDLKKAFVRLGLEVDIFYMDDHEHFFYHRIIRNVNRYARSLRLVKKDVDLFSSHPLNKGNYYISSFKKACSQSKPDAILGIHGFQFGANYLSELAVPKIGWHLEPCNSVHHLAPWASACDVYYSFSHKVIDLLAEAGIACRYMSHAVDPDNFYSQPEAKKIFDVTFVGNWSEWRDEVVQAALEVSGNVAVYGGGWKRKSTIARKTLNQIYKGKEIIGADLNSLFNSSRIVLNASRDKGSSGLNMRFFEVLAAGSVLLTDPVPELETHFIPDTDLVRYRDTAELKHQLAELLMSPQKQDLIRYAGQRLIIERHQYDHMAAQFLKQFHEIQMRNSTHSENGCAGAEPQYAKRTSL